MQAEIGMDATYVRPATKSFAEGRFALWAGRVMSAIPAMFLVFDGVIKVMKPAPVTDAFEQLGYSADQAVGIGVLLLAYTAVYAISRTAALGAVLLTGYLGGAIATQVRVNADPFSMVFPIALGAMLWGGLYLRDARLRELFPLRNAEGRQAT